MRKKSKTNKKNNDDSHNHIMYMIIYFVFVLYISSLYLNYDANKRFDQLWSLEYKEFGYYKGFNFTDEAKAEPVFYWSWNCAPTIDQEYYNCNHCPVIGSCNHHVFKLEILTDDEVSIKQRFNHDRDQMQHLIIIIALLLMIFCFSYWAWQWKYDHCNWKKTPLARLIKKFNEVDKDGNKNK